MNACEAVTQSKKDRINKLVELSLQICEILSKRPINQLEGKDIKTA